MEEGVVSGKHNEGVGLREFDTHKLYWRQDRQNNTEINLPNVLS